MLLIVLTVVLMFLNFIPFAISFKKFGEEIQLARRQGILRPRQQMFKNILFLNTLMLFGAIPAALQNDGSSLPERIFAIIFTLIVMMIFTSLVAILATYFVIWLQKRFWQIEKRA